MRVVAANSAPCNQCFFCLKDRANLCENLVFNNGAYAEYALIPSRILRENVIEIPPHLSFVDAALVEQPTETEVPSADEVVADLGRLTNVSETRQETVQRIVEE